MIKESKISIFLTFNFGLQPTFCIIQKNYILVNEDSSFLVYFHDPFLYPFGPQNVSLFTS